MRRFAPEWLPKDDGAAWAWTRTRPSKAAWSARPSRPRRRRSKGYNFDIRKHVVEYDDVMNKHRDVIYSERRKILEGADLRANVLDMVREEICGARGDLPPRPPRRGLGPGGLLNEVETLIRLPPPSRESA